MSLVLSDIEVIELTRKRRPAAQVRALRHLGINHKQRADGSVMIARSHFDGLFGEATSSIMLAKRTEPDWSKVS